MTISPVRRRTRTRRPARPRHGPASTPHRSSSPGRKGCRRAPVRHAYLTAAVLRCAVYLGPLSVAVAAAGPLSRVAWPVPLLTLLIGWTAAQTLTGTGVELARRAGPPAACRLVGCGFAAAAGLWSALVWVAPRALLGPERGLALVIGLGGLATLATVTAALVTRAEAAIVKWTLPCWLLAAAALAGLPVETLLPSAIVAAAVRAFRPVVIPGLRGRKPRLTRADRFRGAGYLVIGASQGICVGVLWLAVPSGSTLPFWLPLLLAVPILEALIGWHIDQVDAGLDTSESFADLDRHSRRVTLVTMAGLLPPLTVGVALAIAAYEVPPGMRTAVQSAAGGMLLGGVFAITFLLAARTRIAVAAAVAATPPLLLAALPILPLGAGDLPNAVGVLVVTHAAGLLVVALTADDRRTS
jgi:hypothetical protein